MNKKSLIIVAIFILTILALVFYTFAFQKKDITQNNVNQKLPGNICTKEYMPVCGTNGITYGNKCMAQETEVAYEGECLKPNPNAACTFDYTPVCGIDNKTYPNKCNAEEVNGIKVDYEGECNSAAGGTFPAGSPIPNLTDEELASS